MNNNWGETMYRFIEKAAHLSYSDLLVLKVRLLHSNIDPDDKRALIAGIEAIERQHRTLP